MKKIITLPLFLMGFFSGYSQMVTTDSLSRQIKNDNTQVMTVLDKQSKQQDSTKTNLKTLLGSPGAKKSGEVKGFLKVFICLLPAILFLFIIIIIMVKLRNSDVRLSDYLVDKEQQVSFKKEDTKAIVAMAKAGVAPTTATAIINANNENNNSDDDDKKPPQSTSRLLVFVSGITSIMLAVCITCFYIYQYFSGDTNPSLGNLSTVLYGLGLGVLPYGFTKVSGAMKS